MTKGEISESINKHSVRPILLTAAVFIVYQRFDVNFFGETGISPFLTVCYSLAVATYIFKKVLVDLFVAKESQESIQNDL